MHDKFDSDDKKYYITRLYITSGTEILSGNKRSWKEQ